MATNPVKLNLASFDYYIIKIGADTAVAQIESKLANLRKFDTDGKYLAIEFIANLPPEKSEAIINGLKTASDKYQFEVKFILQNKFITATAIAQVPVIAIAINAKIKDIVSQALRIEDPIRSGIKIEHDGDVVVLNLVSNNAEVVAGGSIHVYGDGRGRLIAGCNGDKTARIFVQRFNAELISIGGIFRALEDKLPPNLHNQAVQVFLDDKERLNILPL